MKARFVECKTSLPTWMVYLSRITMGHMAAHLNKALHVQPICLNRQSRFKSCATLFPFQNVEKVQGEWMFLLASALFACFILEKHNSPGHTEPSDNALPYIQGTLRKPCDLRHPRDALTTEPGNTRADYKGKQWGKKLQSRETLSLHFWTFTKLLN